MKIHVEQTTDTDWEIRTGSDHEDRAVDYLRGRQ